MSRSDVANAVVHSVVNDTVKAEAREVESLGAQRRGKLLLLPKAGPLLFATDLHGNLGDFQRIVEIFEARHAEAGRCQLLFCGDLIHGPDYATEDWPDYLGTYYEDRSGEILDALVALQERYPGEVHALLGNHEHSHIGGPHTPKFWMDETAHFEEIVGETRTQRYHALFRSFPVVALSACGFAFTHAAPNVEVATLDEIEAVDYGGLDDMNFMSVYTMPVLGRLLWARRCPDAVAHRFLSVVGEVGHAHHIVAFGHDIAPEGFERFGTTQLMLSTSFGLDDGDKTYLELDLGATYASAEDLVVGRELKSLYP